MEKKIVTTNEMRVGMIRMKGDIAPFLLVGYYGKDDELNPGLIVVDSCSCENILFGDRLESNELTYKKVEGTLNIGTISNETVTAEKAQCSFFINNYLFKDKPFYIAEAGASIPKRIENVPVIGIIGNNFLQEYHLVIDYSDYTLYTSNNNPKNLAIEDCDFFFPMELGLEQYGIPVLLIIQGDKEVIAAADTGATNDTISAQALGDQKFRCEYLEGGDTISGVSGEVEVKEANVEFELVSFINASDMVNIPRKSCFKVLPHIILDPEEGEDDGKNKQKEPIKALIGSPFMAKENWVLDFGARIIFKRKKKMIGLHYKDRKHEKQDSTIQRPTHLNPS